MKIKLSRSNRPHRKRLIGILACALCLFFLQVSYGDEIHLHEGKTLRGKIVKETASDVMINLGSNMFLRVNRDDIKSIKRTSKKKPAGRTVTLDGLKEKEEKKAAEKEEKRELPKNIKAGKFHRSRNKGAATIEETIINKRYTVDGKNFEEIRRAISDPRTGAGFKQDRKRVPSENIIHLEWSGEMGSAGNQKKWQSLKIEGKMTSTSPEWNPRGNFDPAMKEQWDYFIGEVETHNEGHKDIFVRTLDDLAEALSRLSAKDEAELKARSQEVVSDAKSKIKLQQRGHNRRNPVQWTAPSKK